MKKVIVSLSLLMSVTLYGQQVQQTQIVSKPDTAEYVYEHAEFIREQFDVVSSRSEEYQRWFLENFTYPGNCNRLKKTTDPYNPPKN